jgi:hypothetical protein
VQPAAKFAMSLLIFQIIEDAPAALNHKLSETPVNLQITDVLAVISYRI